MYPQSMFRAKIRNISQFSSEIIVFTAVKIAKYCMDMDVMHVLLELCRGPPYEFLIRSDTKQAVQPQQIERKHELFLSFF